MATPRLTGVVVVGGGVTGSAAAWALARQGVGVVLLEQAGPGHGRSGGLRPDRRGGGQLHGALVDEARQLWAELESETGTTVLLPGAGVDVDTAVTAFQTAVIRRGGVVRHHRRVTAVEPDGAGVVVRSAAGAAVHARAAIVAAGASGGTLVLDGTGPVVVADGAGGLGSAAAPAVGRVLADLALGAPATAGSRPLAGTAIRA